MFFHKKLGWLTPNIVTSPVNPCPSPTMSSLGDTPCLGSRTPPISKVLRMAGLKPLASPYATRGPPACRGLSSTALECPVVLMSCSPRDSDFNPWEEKNIFVNEIPSVSTFVSPLPMTPPALPGQPNCRPPPCLAGFPLCHNPCGCLRIIPCAIQTNGMFPCGMGLPMASNYAGMMPCAIKIVNSGPCATKCASHCNTEAPQTPKCASPLPCNAYSAKGADGVPCTVEILSAQNCASPASCITEDATEICYDTKGTTLTSPCGIKGANIHPCGVEMFPSPIYASPTSCATKGATFTSPCSTKCANIHPCGVEMLPAPNCATKGATTIPYATKGATTPCSCATKCVGTIASLPQCACPVPCATKCAISAPYNSCTPNCCCKGHTFTAPQVILKWAGRCGISCPNIGTLSLSQNCTPPNESFAKK